MFTPKKMIVWLLIGSIVGFGLFVMIEAPGVAAQQDCYEYGDLRIVLSWNTNQTDIDLHTYDPEGNHAWYRDLGGIPGGQLDYDDVDGFGPETFTMSEPVTGTYRIQLHYYADHNESGVQAEQIGDGQTGNQNQLDPWSVYKRRVAKTTETVVGSLTERGSPSATATTATVRVYVGGVLQFSASNTLSSVGQWWDAHEFTICGGKPAIVNVEPKYKLDNTRYLEGIPVENPIKVKVNWLGNPPGKVDFKLNGQVIASEEASGSLATHTLNMGSELQDGLNRLEIVAKASGENGQSSTPKTYQFYSIPQPLWIGGLFSMGLSSLPVMASGTVGVGGSDAYEMSMKVPKTPFSIDALRYGPPDGKVKFEWGAEGKLVIPLDCSTAPKAELSAKGGFKFLDSNVALTGYGGIESQRVSPCNFAPPHGFIGAKLDYTETIYRKPVLVMVTYFNVAVGRTVDTIVVFFELEEFVGKLGEFYVDGKIGIDAKIANIQVQDSQLNALVFKDLNLGGSIGLQGGFRADIVVVEVDVYAGASGGITFQRPGEISLPITEDWEFDKIELKGEVGAKFRALWFTREAKGEITWTYPPQANMARLLDQLEKSEWRLIGHYRADGAEALQLAPGAGQIMGRISGQSRSLQLAPSDAITEVLVSNVYPYPELSMTMHPDTGYPLLTWVQTDAAKPVGQAHEIYFSQWNGAAWSQPAAITDNARLDGAPQIAWASNSQVGGSEAVAVWHHMNAELTADATLTMTTANQIEIATAIYSPTTSSWSAPKLVTDNGVLDAFPKVARNSAGDLLTVWRRNQAGLLSGDSSNPDTIMAAFYQQGWGAEMAVIPAIPGIVDLAVGYGDGTATIVYSQNLTPTDQITPTAQLLTSNWNGTSWSAPTQLTDDANGHRDPQILYNTANEPILLWLAGDTLYLRNMTTSSQQVLPLPDDLDGIDEFYALIDSTGNLAALFVNQSLPRNLYLAYYDQTYNVWGNPKAITDNMASEKYLAPVFDAAGQLFVAYTSTAVDLVDKTLTENGESTTFAIPEEGQTDLMTLVYSFARNLTLQDTDLSVSQINAPLGSTVILSATVRNSGEKAVDGVTVAFYLDEPFYNDLIASVVISDVLPGNSSRVVTTSVTVPSFDYDIYAVVDSADVVIESNESDNQARIAIIGPDLDIIGTQVRYWGGANADLVTTIYNRGLSRIPSSLLSYQIDEVNGREVLSTTMPGLDADESVTVTTYLDLSTLDAGRYPMIAEVEPGGSDLSETNNRDQFTLQILPDLQVASQSIDHSPLYSPTVYITSTIVNAGAGSSTPVTFGLYRSDTFDSISRLYTQTVEVLTPTASITIATAVAGPLCSLYVVVDQDGGLDEITKVNNIAALETTTTTCVDFWYEAISGTPESPPYTVQFQDLSTGEKSAWLWDFGDGTTSTEQNPTHTFMNAGRYSITLTLSSENGEPGGVISLLRSELIEVVGAPNRDPTASDESTTTSINTAITVNVLENDSDPDGDALSITAISTPTNGIAVIAGTSIVYTPTAGFTGTETIFYTLSDGRGGEAIATVTIDVTQPNRGPAAIKDAFDVEFDSTDNTLNVLSNDSDADGDSLSISAVTQPANGTVTIDGQQLLYTPKTGFSGTDSFTYTVFDGQVEAQASVTITVASQPNRGPAAINDAFDVDFDSTDNTLNVLSNDSDADGDSLSISAVTQPANGTVTIDGQQLLYTPRMGFSGTDSFTYTVFDGQVEAQASVTITVASQPNRGPAAINDAFDVDFDSADNTLNVLSNDSDADGDSLSISAVTQPANGTVTIDGQQLLYTPRMGFSGTDSFTYTVFDGQVEAQASVTITVQPNDDGDDTRIFLPVVQE